MIDASSTLVDVAFAVGSAFNVAGIEAVLCGGSAATIYVPDRYQSLDLDFVLQFATTGSDVDAALGPLAFVRARSNIYTHPTSRYTIDFPAGPLAIGRDHAIRPRTIIRGAQTLRILGSTDVARDRLMHFLAWGDTAAFRVALAVLAECATSDEVREVERWIRKEYGADPIAISKARIDEVLDALR